MTATNDFAVDLNDSQKRTDAKSTTVLSFWESDGMLYALHPFRNRELNRKIHWNIILDQSHQFQHMAGGKQEIFKRKFFSKTLESFTNKMFDWSLFTYFHLNIQIRHVECESRLMEKKFKSFINEYQHLFQMEYDTMDPTRISNQFKIWKSVSKCINKIWFLF